MDFTIGVPGGSENALPRTPVFGYVALSAVRSYTGGGGGGGGGGGMRRT